MKRSLCAALLSFIGCSLAITTQAATPLPALQVRGAHVYDPATQLLWARCSHGRQWDGEACRGQVALIDLAGAQQWAATLGDGWRIPTVAELGSLMRAEGRLDPRIFPDVADHGEGEAAYWTSSIYEGMDSMVIYLDLLSGRLDVHSPGFALGALAVRDTAAAERH